MNQARASKNNDSGYSAYQRVFGKNPPQIGRCRFGVWRSRPRRSEPAADRRLGTRTVDDYETPCPTGKSSLGPQTSMETSLHHAAKHYKGELHVGQPLWFCRRGANAEKKTQPVHDPRYDRLLKTTRQPMHTSRKRKHSDRTSKTRRRRTNGCGPRISETCAWKTRQTSLEQPSAPTANTSRDTTQQETKEDHDDKRRRIDEPESAVPPAAQDEVLTPCAVTFYSGTRNDEVAVDVSLPEKTVEMTRLDHRRSLLHSLTWCTTSATAQRGEDEPVVTCR